MGGQNGSLPRSMTDELQRHLTGTPKAALVRKAATLCDMLERLRLKPARRPSLGGGARTAVCSPLVKNKWMQLGKPTM